MSFSDEPRVIRHRSWNSKRIASLLIGLAFIGIFLLAVFMPWRQDAIRAAAERGPNFGFVHQVAEHEMELIRIPQGWDRDRDALVVSLECPHHDYDSSAIRVEWRNPDTNRWETLPRDPEGFYGPTEYVLPYNRDIRIPLRLSENGTVLFEGPLWAFSPFLADSKGHSHGGGGHGHDHNHGDGHNH